MWDTGVAPTRVITRGIADPGHPYTGEIPAAATMINEPLRRWRCTIGTDLLAELASHTPIDVWGIDTLKLNDRHWSNVRARAMWRRRGYCTGSPAQVKPECLDDLGVAEVQHGVSFLHDRHLRAEREISMRIRCQ